jgi:hypothetical protein
MTEVLPVTGRTCGQRHLHHDINTGYVESSTWTPASRPRRARCHGGDRPFLPYRECMPVFRYDTRDVVRVLADEPLTCEVAAADQLRRCPHRRARPGPGLVRPPALLGYLWLRRRYGRERTVGEFLASPDFIGRRGPRPAPVPAAAPPPPVLEPVPQVTRP